MDSFNCGSIACTKILEIFNLVTLYEVQLAYDVMSLWVLVTNEWKRFLTRLNNDLIVRVRERIPLCEPVTEPMIANAAAASEATRLDDTLMCFVAVIPQIWILSECNAASNSFIGSVYLHTSEATVSVVTAVMS